MLSESDELTWCFDFIPPFDSCDRQADMAQAYRYFADKLGIRPWGPS